MERPILIKYQHEGPLQSLAHSLLTCRCSDHSSRLLSRVCSAPPSDAVRGASAGGDSRVTGGRCVQLWSCSRDQQAAHVGTLLIGRLQWARAVCGSLFSNDHQTAVSITATHSWFKLQITLFQMSLFSQKQQRNMKNVHFTIAEKDLKAYQCSPTVRLNHHRCMMDNLTSPLDSVKKLEENQVWSSVSDRSWRNRNVKKKQDLQRIVLGENLKKTLISTFPILC